MYRINMIVQVLHPHRPGLEDLNDLGKIEKEDSGE